jgi:hypothetical protein
LLGWRVIALVGIWRVKRSRDIWVVIGLVGAVAAGLRVIVCRIVGIAPIVEAEIVSVGIEQVRISGPIGVSVDCPVLELTPARVEAIAIGIPAAVAILIEAARRVDSA